MHLGYLASPLQPTASHPVHLVAATMAKLTLSSAHVEASTTSASKVRVLCLNSLLGQGLLPMAYVAFASLRIWITLAPPWPILFLASVLEGTLQSSCKSIQFDVWQTVEATVATVS